MLTKWIMAARLYAAVGLLFGVWVLIRAAEQVGGPETEAAFDRVMGERDDDYVGI